MQISSSNSGAYASSGLTSSGSYSAVPPTARKPEAGASSNASVAISAASNARSLQQIAPSVTPTNSEATRGLVLARQRAGFDVLAGIVQIGQSGGEAVALRAVAEYNTVASQEQRFELDDALVGIDVFA